MGNNSGSKVKASGYGKGKPYPGGKISSKSTAPNLHPMKSAGSKPKL